MLLVRELPRWCAPLAHSLLAAAAGRFDCKSSELLSLQESHSADYLDGYGTKRLL